MFLKRIFKHIEIVIHSVQFCNFIWCCVFSYCRCTRLYRRHRCTRCKCWRRSRKCGPSCRKKCPTPSLRCAWTPINKCIWKTWKFPPIHCCKSVGIAWTLGWGLNGRQSLPRFEDHRNMEGSFICRGLLSHWQRAFLFVAPDQSTERFNGFFVFFFQSCITPLFASSVSRRAGVTSPCASCYFLFPRFTFEREERTFWFTNHFLGKIFRL